MTQPKHKKDRVRVKRADLEATNAALKALREQRDVATKRAAVIAHDTFRILMLAIHRYGADSPEGGKEIRIPAELLKQESIGLELARTQSQITDEVIWIVRPEEKEKIVAP